MTCGLWHPEPCEIITLQGLEMITSSKTGTPYGVMSIDGWATGAVGTGGPVPWETADGGVMGDVYYAGRSIVIEGDIDAADHAEYAEAVEALGTVLSNPRRDWLVVDESVHLGMVRQIEVARTRPVQITQLGVTYGIFTLSLEAAGFARLGVDQQSAAITTAGVALQNVGNHPAELSLILTGPLTNPGISWPGGAWTYTGTIPSGTTINVDMARRIVRNPATTAHSRNLAAGTWLALPPGTTTVTRTGTGTGTITARWRSAWS